MITVREVSSKRDQKEFLDFPLRLYKNEPNFVPPLYGDEKKIFREDYIYYDTSEAVYYIAEENGETVGRISGILQKASNEKCGEKRIRFTRFDAVNRQEVADALFAAVEDWGRAKGMTEICGPLGFSDLEREGLLSSSTRRNLRYRLRTARKHSQMMSTVMKIVSTFSTKTIRWWSHAGGSWPRLSRPRAIRNRTKGSGWYTTPSGFEKNSTGSRGRSRKCLPPEVSSAAMASRAQGISTRSRAEACSFPIRREGIWLM